MHNVKKIFLFLAFYSLGVCCAQTTINLKDVPPPRVIPVPKTTGGSYLIKTKSGQKKIKLQPPETKSADIYSIMQNYTTDHGLAMDAISLGHKNGLFDSKGNLWFGTNGGGVSRYDGQSFTNYTTAQGLVNNIVQCILEDKRGDLWFGTREGVSRFDGRSFTNYTTSQGLPNNTVWAIAEDKTGNVWIGTYGGGLSRYDGKSFTNYTTAQGLASNIILSITEDKTGNFWLGTSGGGVSRYDGKTFTNYTTAQGLINNIVLSSMVDETGNLWFGTKEGLSRYDGKSFTNYTTAQGLVDNIVVSMLEDKTGNLWFGTKEGLSRYDGKYFSNYTAVQGLANNSVHSITEDKTGNLWFGTNGGGLSRYDGNSFMNYTTLQGLASNIVLSITEDKRGNLWFGTSGGLSCYGDNCEAIASAENRKDKKNVKKSFTNYTTAQGLVDNFVMCITEDKTGNLWFGTSEGVSLFDGKSFTNYTTAQGLSNNVVRCIAEDNSGDIWFGTYGGGALRYNGNRVEETGSQNRKTEKLVKSFTNYTTTQGLANNKVISILVDRAGNLWFGTNGGGVSRYNGKSFTNFTTAEGLAHNTVLSITEDKMGNIWFGTDGGGISRFDGRTFTNYTTVNGLPDNSVTQIIIDKQDNIIIGTNFGIAVLKYLTTTLAVNNELRNIPAQNSLPSEELKNYIPSIEIYNSATGYPVKDVNSGQNTMFCDSKGITWIATGADKTGLVRFDYSAVNKNLAPLTIVFKNIKINGTNICFYSLSSEKDSTTKSQQEIMTYGKLLSDHAREELKNKFGDIRFDSITKFYPVPENLILPYTNNHIGFEFVAIEPARPYLVKYQYMLVGMDKDWSPLSDKTSAEFNNLWEGTYTFKLRAQSPFGVWSDPITYTFKVLPPWWRTWWMYLLYIIVMVSGVVLIVRWNNRRLIAQKNKLKTKIVRATNTIREEKEKIQKANELINEQRQAAEEQKKIVEEKNKDILDSIHYAKRIQYAMLIKREYFEDYIPEYMLLFMPKDIVSGDFYWAHSKFNDPQKSANENMHWYLAAADCTGHGVPGAVMSMLGMSFLNEIIKNNDSLTPAEILHTLREKVIKELGQNGDAENSKDGMDISLVRWNFRTNEFLWAGANNPIYLIRNGQLEKIKGDKQPIGYFPEPKPFTNHSFRLEKSDCFYIFSDGYADQFGGPLGKKFKYKQLEDLLLKNYQLPMKEQRKILRDTFNNWKGELDQVDDVCVVGIRVS